MYSRSKPGCTLAHHSVRKRPLELSEPELARAVHEYFGAVDVLCAEMRIEHLILSST